MILNMFVPSNTYITVLTESSFCGLHDAYYVLDYTNS